MHFHVNRPFAVITHTQIIVPDVATLTIPVLTKTEDIDPSPENLVWIEKLTDALKSAQNIGANWDPENESEFQKGCRRV